MLRYQSGRRKQSDWPYNGRLHLDVIWCPPRPTPRASNPHQATRPLWDGKEPFRREGAPEEADLAAQLENLNYEIAHNHTGWLKDQQTAKLPSRCPPLCVSRGHHPVRFVKSTTNSGMAVRLQWAHLFPQPCISHPGLYIHIIDQCDLLD